MVFRVFERRLEEQQVYETSGTLPGWSPCPQGPSSVPFFMALKSQYATWVTLLFLHEDHWGSLFFPHPCPLWPARPRRLSVSPAQVLPPSRNYLEHVLNE